MASVPLDDWFREAIRCAIEKLPLPPEPPSLDDEVNLVVGEIDAQRV